MSSSGKIAASVDRRSGPASSVRRGVQDPISSSSLTSPRSSSPSARPFTIGQGETVATFVRLGTKVPWIAGFFSNAAAVASTAAAAEGVTALAPCRSVPFRGSSRGMVQITLMFETQELPATEIPAPASRCPRRRRSPMHLLDRLNAVFKHRRLAGTAFLLVVTAMMMQTYSTIPIYQTSVAGPDPGRADDAGRQPERERPDLLAGRRIRTTRRSTRSCRAARSAQRVVKQARSRRTTRMFSGSAPAAARSDLADATGARGGERVGPRRSSRSPPPASRRRRRRRIPRSEAALVSAFLGGRHVVPEQRHAAREHLLPHSNPEFAAHGRERAGGRVHAAEPRPPARRTPTRCSRGSRPS